MFQFESFRAENRINLYLNNYIIKKIECNAWIVSKYYPQVYIEEEQNNSVRLYRLSFAI